MSTVAAYNATPPAEAAAVSDGLLALVERAARDPNVDVDKMERLLLMRERVMKEAAKTAFAAALSEMQAELPVIEERGTITIPTKSIQQHYALWEDINAAILPILHRHGFALSFRTGMADGKIAVTGVLSHKEGHSEETTMHLPADTSGSKNAVQAIGSSTSYGKRYTAMALLNLTSRLPQDRDDDGVAGGAQTITEDQVGDLMALLESVNADRRKFLEFFGIEALPQLPVARYAEATRMLNQKGRR